MKSPERFPGFPKTGDPPESKKKNWLPSFPVQQQRDEKVGYVKAATFHPPCQMAGRFPEGISSGDKN